MVVMMANIARKTESSNLTAAAIRRRLMAHADADGAIGGALTRSNGGTEFLKRKTKESLAPPFLRSSVSPFLRVSAIASS
jgi:hypothetical protein